MRITSPSPARFRGVRLAAIAAALLLATPFLGAGLASPPLSGAIFTTNAAGDTVDQNQYALKCDVYLNGGPPINAPASAAGLPDGTYYYQITDPSGAVVLAAPNDATHDSILNTVTVTGGVVTPLAQLCDTSSGTYATTPNNGGVYKVWITSVADYNTYGGFNPSATKTDVFKVLEDGGGGEEQGDGGSISGTKFYDLNTDGVFASEAGIAGWRIELWDTAPSPDVLVDFMFTDANGDYEFTGLPAGTYEVREVFPLSGVWVATTGMTVGVTLSTDEVVEDVDFGNVCVGAGGGHTLGYWSNKNGQARITQAMRDALTALNLRNADGTNFVASSNGAIRTWLLSATATNMAYMLSAQLAATTLSIMAGDVSASSLVYAPLVPGSNSAGFITIGALATASNNALADPNGYTVGASAIRTQQEILKNALDAANNNSIFVQAGPCAFDTPYSPA
jgi:hypothetical protein